MPSGIIAVNTIPGWPNPAAGLGAAAQAAGLIWSFEPDGLHVNDLAASNALIASYSGSTTELQLWKTKQQAALDTLFDANFVLTSFIRNGTVTNITGANVGAFIAQISNNYRTLRAQIAAATTVAQVQAVNINAGWPANP